MLYYYVVLLLMVVSYRIRILIRESIRQFKITHNGDKI